jgi:hypothetical protein
MDGQIRIIIFASYPLPMAPAPPLMRQDTISLQKSRTGCGTIWITPGLITIRTKRLMRDGGGGFKIQFDLARQARKFISMLHGVGAAKKK